MSAGTNVAAVPSLPKMEPVTSSSTELQVLLEEARTDAREAADALTAAQAGYRDRPSLDAKERQTRAEVDADVSLREIERLERELTAAEHREHQADLMTRYEAARPLAAEAETLHARYEELAREIVRTITRLGEIEVALTTVNAELPEGADPHPIPSQSRGFTSGPLIQRRTIRVEGWCDAIGEPLERNALPFMQRKRAEGPPFPGAIWGSWELTTETVNGGTHRPAGPFDRDLNLPALRIGDKPIWPVRK